MTKYQLKDKKSQEGLVALCALDLGACRITKISVDFTDIDLK